MNKRDSISFSCFIKTVFLKKKKSFDLYNPDLVTIFRRKVENSVNSSCSSCHTWTVSFITYRHKILCHGDLFGLLSGHFRFSPGMFCDRKPFDDFCLCSTATVHAMPSLSWRTEGKRLSSHVYAAANITVNSATSRSLCDAEGLLMVPKLPLCLCTNI